MLTADIQYECTDRANIPDQAEIEAWLIEIFETTGKKGSNTLLSDVEISIRFVDAHESQELNTVYRGKTAPTNVLSFPCDLPPELDLPLLGDLVICKPVVESEAHAQSKTVTSHWCHMITHGTLHLLGYDHIEDNDANQMEALEIHILNALGFTNPYTLL